MQPQVKRREEVPVGGLQRPEPGMRPARRGAQVAHRRHASLEEITRPLELADDFRPHAGRGLHVGRARDPRRRFSASQQADQLPRAAVDDAQVIHRHVHRPVAAAILQAHGPLDEHAPRVRCAVAAARQFQDGCPLPGERGRGTLAGGASVPPADEHPGRSATPAWAARHRAAGGGVQLPEGTWTCLQSESDLLL